MATNCDILYVDQKTGNTIGIHVLRIGFPGYTGTVLLKKYNSADKVKDLLSLGHLYQIGYKTEPVPEEIKSKGFEYSCHTSDYCVSLVRDKEYDSLTPYEISQVNRSKISQDNYLHAIDDLNKDASQHTYMWKDDKWYFRKWRSKFEEMTEILISHDEENDG
jgi:hypothetical protein